MGVRMLVLSRVVVELGVRLEMWEDGSGQYWYEEKRTNLSEPPTKYNGI